MPDRVEREAEFHDRRYRTNSRQRLDSLYDGLASGVYYRSRVESIPVGTDVLEYGCGEGSASLWLAADRRVAAIDISSVAVENASEHARRLGLTLDVRVADAEHLPYADNSFDAVVGSGILHHLDLAAAWAEITRVLRPEGRAIFSEPLGHNPALRLFRRLTPDARTPDEHPLLDVDIAAASEHFQRFEARYFELLGMGAAVAAKVPVVGASLASALRAADRSLLDRPTTLLHKHAWTVVLEGSRPRRGAAA
jgi:SAM-dependent methyltransferase